MPFGLLKYGLSSEYPAQHHFTPATELKKHYDVVIIGGAMMGASAAWSLSDDKDFDGKVLVVDRDLS